MNGILVGVHSLKILFPSSAQKSVVSYNACLKNESSYYLNFESYICVVS